MKTIRLSSEDYHFLMELQQELATQPNDGNADPVYWGVMETTLRGVPDGCGDPIIHIGDGVTMDTAEAVAYIGNEYLRYCDETNLQEWAKIDKNDMNDVVRFMNENLGWHEVRVVYQRREEFISRETGTFLTKRACQNYIDNFGYNHSNPHTYAMTAYRNFELERLLKILREGLDFSPTKSIWHKMTEDADPKRFVVLSDCVDHISERLRWPFAEFVRDSKKKDGIYYTKWAYQDDLMKL